MNTKVLILKVPYESLLCAKKHAQIYDIIKGKTQSTVIKE